MIVSSNTIIDPWTVMVIDRDTLFAELTVFAPFWLDNLTICTNLIVIVVLENS